MSRVPFAFEASTKPPRDGKKFALRFWANRHARLMELTYSVVESTLRGLAPLFKLIGYERMEKPMVVVEKTIKSALFDCRMCGQCILFHRHVLPNELPEKFAQWAVRRCAREWQLRSLCRDALCVGEGLGRQSSYERGRQDHGCAKAD